MSQHSIFSLREILNNHNSLSASFSIIDLVEYVFNLFNLKAVENGITLVLHNEPGFPKEVQGNIYRFELILATILDYLLKNSKNGEIILSLKLKQPLEDGFLCEFDFEFPEGENLHEEKLRKLLKSSIHLENVLDLWKTNNYTITQTTHIIENMNGTLEISEKEKPGIMTAKIMIEIPFKNKDTSQEIISETKIDIFRTEKVTEFTKKWTAVMQASRPESSVSTSKRKFNRAITAKIDGAEELIRNKIKAAVSKLPRNSIMSVQPSTIEVPHNPPEVLKTPKLGPTSRQEYLVKSHSKESLSNATQSQNKKSDSKSDINSRKNSNNDSKMSEAKESQSIMKLAYIEEPQGRGALTPPTTINNNQYVDINNNRSEPIESINESSGKVKEENKSTFSPLLEKLVRKKSKFNDPKDCTEQEYF